MLRDERYNEIQASGFKRHFFGKRSGSIGLLNIFTKFDICVGEWINKTFIYRFRFRPKRE